MQKRKRMYIMLIALILIVLVFESGMIQAAVRKDVTRQRKSEIQKFLEPYSGFLAYPVYGDKYHIVRNSNYYCTVKFDNYFKTNMLLYTWEDNIDTTGKTKTKDAKKILLSRIKETFGNSAKFKLRKYKKYTQYIHTSYPNLFANINGKIHYIGGDWGMGIPYGRVKKVHQVTKNKYLVEYDSCDRTEGEKLNPKKDYHATYHIYLKSGSKGINTIAKVKLIKKLVKDEKTGVLKIVKCQDE